MKINPNTAAWALLCACRYTKQTHSKAGICYNVMTHLEAANTQLFNACVALLRDIMKTWPEYSGNCRYPVPHSRLRAGEAYMSCFRWTRFTRYGRARRRLLAYIIYELESRIY